MTPEQKAALINAQTLLANAELMGMVAENQKRMSNRESLAYGESEFKSFGKKWDPIIGYNAILEIFHDRPSIDLSARVI